MNSLSFCLVMSFCLPHAWRIILWDVLFLPDGWFVFPSALWSLTLLHPSLWYFCWAICRQQDWDPLHVTHFFLLQRWEPSVFTLGVLGDNMSWERLSWVESDWCSLASLDGYDFLRSPVIISLNKLFVLFMFSILCWTHRYFLFLTILQFHKDWLFFFFFLCNCIFQITWLWTHRGFLQLLLSRIFSTVFLVLLSVFSSGWICTISWVFNNVPVFSWSSLDFL